MDQDAIFATIQDILSTQLGIEAAEVDIDSDFIEDLGADSLDIVELVMELEEEFGLEIPDEDAEQIATVRDAVDYIEESL